MSIGRLILLVTVLLVVGRTGEPMLPPSVREVCSQSGEYCARLGPADNSILVY